MRNVIQSIFYNATYNLGRPDGKSKFVWGVKEIDFSKDIQSQLIGDELVFNFNLTSLNPIFNPSRDEGALREENELLTAIATNHATRADELYEAGQDVMFVLNTFKKDLDQGFITKDKEFAVSILENFAAVLDKSRIEAEEGNSKEESTTKLNKDQTKSLDKIISQDQHDATYDLIMLMGKKRKTKNGGKI